MCYTDRQIDNRIKRLIELETLKADLDKQILAIEEELKTDMGDNEEVKTSKYRVQWQTILQQRFDTKAFKASNGALYSKFVKPVVSKRFTYKTI